MIWVILTALAAVCGAAKLDTNYLVPISARTAGGSAGALLAPFDGSQGLPTGGYTNDAQGVVVDAVNPGTRTSGLEPTGLGGPRTSYGSKDSKVGDAAFGISGSISPGLTRIAPGFGSFVESDDPQADKASGNSLKFTSDVGLDNYSYGFETDNGISVGENGEAAGGVKAQGEYSYKGDDGKKYTVSYTADKEGYKPQGQHLPTPPPIPDEILISLEKNAKEEAAGHVDDGSYTAQKYNDEGDYTSNGAGNNNGRPTIGGGDATSSGSYVSQDGQRLTSGTLVGSYNPGSIGSLSSQFGQVSGNKQSSFGINKVQSGSQDFTVSGGSSSIGGQFGQAGSKDSNIVSHDQHSSQTGSTQSTESRFGVQTSKPEGSHAHAHASAGSPFRSPSIHNGASAFSSAVVKGSGSANAFASTAPLGSGLKNEYVPPSSSFGSAGQHTHASISGSDSSVGASFPAPSTPTASASVTGSQTLGSQTHSHSNLPSSGSASASVSGNQHSYGHLNQQQAVPSRFGEGQQATFASSTQKPFISQQQGSDDSYYYKQPSKPFITPPVIPSGQYSINRQPNVPFSSIHQQGSKYPNTPATVATGQNQGTSSSNYNGITQASISPFPSGSLSSSSQFASQSSQFGSKPSTQFGQTSQPISTQFGSTETHSGHKVQGQTQFAQSGLQAPTQFGSTETHSGHQTQSQTQFGQSSTTPTSDSSKSPTQQYQGTIYQYNKPGTALSGNEVQGQTQFVQSGLQVPTQSGSTETHFGHQTSQTSDSSQAPTQQYHGTIYQYNKPDTTLPAQGHKDTSSFAQATGGKPGQVETDSRFGTQQSSSQFGSQSTFQQNPTGSNVQNSQFGQKPIVSSQVSGSNYQFGSSGSQFVQKPVTTQGSIVSSNTNTQSQTSSVQKPIVSSQTTADFGSTGSQFGSKPQTTHGSSFTYSQSQSSQFGKKPVVSTTQTGTQFGSSSSQFGQNSQSTFGSGSVSTTAKPLGSSYQQTQFGSKPSTTQGSSFTYTQSQNSQFGKKPVISTTQTGTQFGSGSQFGQNSQSTFGSGSVSTTAKPIGSSYQQTGSQFGQNVQSSSGAGLVSTTVKPAFGSSYQQTQFGSKPQTTQGSGYTYSQATSQTSQFGKKPVSTAQTSVTSQQPQFGASGSQFGLNSQSTFGSGSVSTTAKPLGTSYQQTQFGSKPSTTQGSSFTYTQSQTSQFGKKPVVSTTQTGTPFGSGSQFGQNSQFGSYGSQFGQNSQSTFGSGSVSTTAKPIGSSYQETGSQFGQNIQSSSGAGSVSTTVKPPFGSSYQQTQFGSKPSTTQGSSFTYTQSQNSQFGKKPVAGTTQTGTQFGSGSQFGQNSQFGSSGSQFGQNSQSTFGSGSVLATAKPVSSSYQQTGSQFSQNVQSSSGAGSVSTTVKPAFGSSYQQTQFGSKPSTSQGSSFTYTQSQNSQFGKKPVVSTTQTGTQFGQNSQSTVGAGLVSSTVKPAIGSSYQQTQFGSKPTTTQGSSFTYTQGQTTPFGKKPVISTTQTGTQFGSGSQFGQNSQFGLSGSQFGQNSQSTFGSGSVSTTAKPISSSYQQTGSQFGQNSQFGSSGSQFGQNSQSTFGSGSVSTTAKPFGSSYQQTGSQFGQNVQSSSGAGSISTTVKPTFGSSYQQTQFGSKPQTTQGSGYTYSQATSQTSQFGKKPVSTAQTGVTSQQSQFGSSGSQFGLNSQSTFAKPVGSSYQQTQFGSKPSTSQGSSFTYTQSQNSQFGKKPVVSTTQTGTPFGSGSQFGQNSQFGSYGSQFGQNSQSTFGSGSVSTTAKPIGSSYQQTASQFGQNVQSSSGAGSVSTTVKPTFGSSYQQTQFGSKPSTTQGSSFTYTQSQNSQFGKKPVASTTQTGTQFGSGSQFGQNSQFGSSGSQFGQNSQSTYGSGSVSTTAKPIGSSYQQTGSQFGQNSQFGSSGSQFSQNSQSTFGSGSVSTTAKPIGSSYQQTGSQFGQNVQTSSGAGSVSTTVKPTFGSSYQQTQFGSKPSTTQGSSFTYTQSQNSQYGKKPVVSTTQTGTPFGSGSQFGQNSQFGSYGSQFGQNSQSTFGSGSVSTTAKPFGASNQQTQFGSTGFQFGQNSQSQGSAIALTTSKPVVGITPVYQQAQFGSSGSQFGQNSQSSQGFGSVSTNAKPAFGQTSFGSTSQNTQLGSSGSQFVQHPQAATQGSSYSSNKGSAGEAVQTTQFGVAGSSQSIDSQGAQYGSGSSNKVSGSSSIPGSSFQQTQLAGTSGSQIGQTTQYGIKPFGSAQSTQGATQFGSTPSRFGESSQTIVPISTISQIVEPTQFAQKPFQTPFGSSTTNFGQNPQAHAFASSSGSNVVPFSSTQTGQVSKYETSKFGVQNQGVVSSTQKPVGSSLAQANYQQYQYTQTADKSGSQSQFGPGSQSNVGGGQIGQTTFGAQSQKPFGSQSTQTTYQQTQFTQGQKPFGSSQGSAFQIGGQSIGDQPTQGTVQTTSVTGYNYQKPQSVVTTQYGIQSNDAQDQKVQQSQTNFNSAVSTVQTPINGQTFNPFGVPSTQGTFQQSQSTVSSSLIGAQAVKPTDFTGPVIQTSYNKFSGKPFQPASTVSTQGSNAQSQSSAFSTSLFGLQPTPSTELAHFSGKPEYSILPSHGVALNPSVSSSTQTPSRVGVNEGLVVSTVQTPIVPVPGYELVVNEGAGTNQGLVHSFAGLGEQFGGPRDPPRFDDKTGYHY